MEKASDASVKKQALSRLPGVPRLVAKRGDEEVAFSQVADHLVDFAAHHPEQAPVVDALGAFLAAVEDLPHDHDQPAGSKGA